MTRQHREMVPGQNQPSAKVCTSKTKPSNSQNSPEEMPKQTETHLGFTQVRNLGRWTAQWNKAHLWATSTHTAPNGPQHSASGPPSKATKDLETTLNSLKHIKTNGTVTGKYKSSQAEQTSQNCMPEKRAEQKTQGPPDNNKHDAAPKPQVPHQKALKYSENPEESTKG